MAVPGKKVRTFIGDKESDEVLNLFCQPCSEVGHTLPVAGYCINCREYLCDACYTHHCRARSYREHVLQNKESMPKYIDQATIGNQDTTETCPEHEGEVIKFHCRSHGQFVCGTCIGTRHRKCDDVSYIEDDYAKLKQELDLLNQGCDTSKEKAEKNSLDIETYCTTAIEDLNIFRREIKIFFDKLETKTRYAAKMLRDEDNKKISSISNKCNSVRKELDGMATELDTLHGTKQNTKLFFLMEKAHTRVKKLQDDLKNIERDNKIRQYEFKADKKITAIMNTEQVIGEISETSAQFSENKDNCSEEETVDYYGEKQFTGTPTAIMSPQLSQHLWQFEEIEENCSEVDTVDNYSEKQSTGSPTASMSLQPSPHTLQFEENEENCSKVDTVDNYSEKQNTGPPTASTYPLSSQYAWQFGASYPNMTQPPDVPVQFGYQSKYPDPSVPFGTQSKYPSLSIYPGSASYSHYPFTQQETGTSRPTRSNKN